MNRQKLGQLTTLITIVLVGGSLFNIYSPEQGVTGADYADAGVTAGNRVATCPVRIDPECASQFGTGLYETARFPVFRNVLTDGGIEILLPPRIRKAARCLEVMDWTKCDLNTNATYPAVAAKWDDKIPVVIARSSSKYVIPDCRGTDGGWQDNHSQVDCFSVEDGGSVWRGCNILLRSNSTGTKCLNAPTGVVNAGERLEDSL